MNILLQLSSQEYAIMWNPHGKWISNFHLSNRVEQTKMQKSYKKVFLRNKISNNKDINCKDVIFLLVTVHGQLFF